MCFRLSRFFTYVCVRLQFPFPQLLLLTTVHVLISVRLLFPLPGPIHGAARVSRNRGAGVALHQPPAPHSRPCVLPYETGEQVKYSNTFPGLDAEAGNLSNEGKGSG